MRQFFCLYDKIKSFTESIIANNLYNKQKQIKSCIEIVYFDQIFLFWCINRSFALVFLNKLCYNGFCHFGYVCTNSTEFFAVMSV